MAKRRFRIEGGNYGGELVLGEVSPAFASHYAESQDHVVEAVLEADQMGWGSDDEPEDALLDPDAPPMPRDDFNMWENDDIEHLNAPYSDSDFTVYEVPADGSDDWNYDKEVFEGKGICVYGREGGYFGHEEPEIVNEEDDEGNKYVPVLCFHSSEKGTFTSWFVDTDEDFDEFKLGYSIVETNLCELIENVYYDKQELEANYDYNDTTGKGYYAEVGWLNMKWHDSDELSQENMEEYWLEYDDNVEEERELRG